MPPWPFVKSGPRRPHTKHRVPTASGCWGPGVRVGWVHARLCLLPAVSLGPPLSLEPLFLIRNTKTTSPAALSVAAVTKYCGLGDVSHRSPWSYGSAGWESEVKASASCAPPEGAQEECVQASLPTSGGSLACGNTSLLFPLSSPRVSVCEGSISLLIRTAVLSAQGPPSSKPSSSLN